MTRSDVKPGDSVKNGRTGRWAKVLEVDADAVTGRVLRLKVQRRRGYGLDDVKKWWLASTITMIEAAKDGAK